MDVENQQVVVAALAQALADASQLAAWAVDKKSEGVHTGVARRLQQAQPVMDAYAAMDPGSAQQMLQRQGLFVPLPAVVRRVLGLPAKQCGMATWRVAPEEIETTQAMWAEVIRDLRDIGTSPSRPSLEALGQQMRAAQQAQDAEGLYCVAQQLYAFRPWAKALGHSTAPCAPLLGMAFAAACAHSAEPLRACHWGTQLFKRALAPAAGAAACPITPQHLCHVAALITHHTTPPIPKGQQQARQHLASLTNLWSAMQAYCQSLSDSDYDELVHQAPGAAQKLEAAGQRLLGLNADVAQADATVVPLSLCPRFCRGRGPALLGQHLRADFDLADYAPLPKFAAQLIADLHAAANGALVAGRNYLVVSPPGHGKSSLIDALLAHVCAASRTVADGWGRRVYVARATASDFLGSVYDESRRKVNTYFAHVHEEAKKRDGVAVVVIEELDILLARWDGVQQEDNRITQAFLRYTDNTLPGKTVFVVGTTNHPEVLDAAAASRFVAHAYRTPASIRHKLLAALWDNVAMPDPRTTEGAGRLPSLTELTMAISEGLGVRHLEQACSRVRCDHLSGPGEADVHGALFAFLQQVLPQVGDAHGSSGPPGLAPVTVASASAAHIELVLPRRRLLHMIDAGRRPDAAVWQPLYHALGDGQSASFFVGRAGIHCFVIGKERRLAEDFKVWLNLRFRLPGRDIDRTDGAPLTWRFISPAGQPSVGHYLFAAQSLRPALLEHERLDDASLLLDIRLTGGPQFADRSLFAQFDPWAS